MNPSTTLHPIIIAPKEESTLSSIPAQYFPLTIVIGTISTIACTYTLSTYQGHTQPFPYTDITHTARFTPERYVFRCGMLAMAVVMAWNWTLLYAWLKNIQLQIDTLQKKIAIAKNEQHQYGGQHSYNSNNSVLILMMMNSKPSNHLLKVIWYLGIIAAIAITTSSMCITSNSDMPMRLHILAAGTFFISCLVAQGITTYKSFKLYQQLNKIREESSYDERLSEISLDAHNITFMTKNSLYLKIAITGLTIVSLVVSVLNSIATSASVEGTEFNDNIHLKSTTSNIVEWLCTLLIVLYNVTFAMDWSNCKLLTSISQIQTVDVQQRNQIQNVQPCYKLEINPANTVPIR